MQCSRASGWPETHHEDRHEHMRGRGKKLTEDALEGGHREIRGNQSPLGLQTRLICTGLGPLRVERC